MNKEDILNKIKMIKMSYSINNYGYSNMSPKERALIDYEKLVMKLIKKNDDLQQRIDKAVELCNIVLKNEPLETNINYDLIDHVSGIKEELLRGTKDE